MDFAFGVQVLKAVEDRSKRVGELLFLVEKFVLGVEPFVGLGLESSQRFFVQNPSGEEGGGEEIIVEEGLLGG